MSKSLAYLLLLLFTQARIVIEQHTITVDGVYSTAKNSMREAIDIVSLEGKNFSFVNLNLSDEEIATLDSLHISVPFEQYDHFGSLKLLQDKLVEFLVKVGDNPKEQAEKAACILDKIISSVVQASNKDSAWVCVRASTPKPHYNPRWHTDGCYYSSDSGKQVKFVAALKGAQTLFYNLPSTLRDAFIRLQDSNNQAAVNKLINFEGAIHAQKGFGAYFIVGDPICAAIHSEPPIQEERLFLSVASGNESEIKELYDRWHPAA